jgi:hypothetical protein
MTKRPENVEWIGFTEKQAKLLDFLDRLGNNGWSRNPQTEQLMPKVLGQLHDLGVPISRTRVAMASIGYETAALHELERWESKRTTGRFGR